MYTIRYGWAGEFGADTTLVGYEEMSSAGGRYEVIALARVLCELSEILFSLLSPENFVVL